MTKAIFHKDFNYSSRKRNVGWSVKASDEPQSFPRELIDAAIQAKVAEFVLPKRKKQPEKSNSADEQ